MANIIYEVVVSQNPVFEIVVNNGAKGHGVIAGGTTNQVLVKKSNSDYDTMWVTASVVTPVDSVNGQVGDVVLDYEDVGASPSGHAHADKMNIDGSNSNVDKLTFDTTPSSDALVEGQMRWNSTDGTLDLQHASATQQVGQELFIKVINKTGATIPNASAVYFDGRQGNRPKIKLAQSNSESTSHVMGITTQDILDNEEGFITSFGYVRQIKTDYVGWTEGATLYVSSTVAGGLTITEPSAPNHADIVGSVGIVGGLGIGSILVKIERHKDLTDLSDVNGTPLATEGQIPVWHEPEKYFDFDYNINDYVLKVAGKSLVADTAITDLTDGGDTTLHTHKSIVNEVSVDNAKVEALATGINVVRNVADANHTFTVTQHASATGNLGLFKLGTVTKFAMNSAGYMYCDGLSNGSSINNAKLQMATTGLVATRNIADANPALIVNQANASSTGKIEVWQFGGVEKATMDITGKLTSQSVSTQSISNGGYYYTSFGMANNNGTARALVSVNIAGTVISRDYADANSALTVNNINASSAGLITDFQFGGVSKFSIDRFGQVAQEAWITPTFLNSHTALAAKPFRYRKNAFGRIEFDGKIVCSGTAVVCNLPAGYRPSGAYTEMVGCRAGFGTTKILQIAVGGDVSIVAGVNAETYDFSGCGFYL